MVAPILFFSIRFSFTDTDDSLDSRGKERTILSFLCHFRPLRNIQTFICNFACEIRYYVLLMASLVFTRLLLVEIYHFIELQFVSFMMKF